ERPFRFPAGRGGALALQEAIKHGVRGILRLRGRRPRGGGRRAARLLGSKNADAGGAAGERDGKRDREAARGPGGGGKGHPCSPGVREAGAPAAQRRCAFKLRSGPRTRQGAAPITAGFRTGGTSGSIRPAMMPRWFPLLVLILGLATAKPGWSQV